MSLNPNTSWKTTKYKMLVLQKNIFLGMAISSCASLMICIFFIKSMYESKTIEPYLINIDKYTGLPSVVSSQTFKEYTAQDAIKEYFIVDYIVTREMIERQSNKDVMDKIRILSSPNVFTNFKTSRSKLISKINTLGPDVISSIKIGQPNYITPKKVEIKFQIDYRSERTGKSMSSRFAAYLDFDFLELKYSVEERRINPLGFQVISYTLVEENNLI